MRTLYRDRPKAKQGETLWRNPTARTLKIKLFGKNGERQIVEAAPGALVPMPSAYDDNMARICKFLVPADAAPESPAHEVAPAPTAPTSEPEPALDVTLAPPDEAPAPKPSRPRKKRTKRTTKKTD